MHYTFIVIILLLTDKTKNRVRETMFFICAPQSYWPCNPNYREKSLLTQVWGKTGQPQLS